MNFYKEVPEGYTEDKVIDMKEDKKTAVLMNVFAFIIAIAVGIISAICRFGIIHEISIDEEVLGKVSKMLLIACVLLLAYMVLHELVHGAAYKILTKEKLTFGISLSCAFCGVPKIYTTKKTALIALLAPFVLFSALLIPLIVLLPSMWSGVMIILFACHIGGCIGDLYCTCLLIFKYRGKKTLVNDTGPKQTFYIYSKDCQ